MSAISSSSIVEKRFVRFTLSDNNNKFVELKLRKNGNNLSWVLVSSMDGTNARAFKFDRIEFFSDGKESVNTLHLGYSASLGEIEKWKTEGAQAHTRDVDISSSTEKAIDLVFDLPAFLIAHSPKQAFGSFFYRSYMVHNVWEIALELRCIISDVVPAYSYLWKQPLIVGSMRLKTMSRATGTDCVAYSTQLNDFADHFQLAYTTKPHDLSALIDPFFGVAPNSSFKVVPILFTQQSHVKIRNQQKDIATYTIVSEFEVKRFDNGNTCIQCLWNSLVDATKDSVSVSLRGNRVAMAPVFANPTSSRPKTSYTVVFDDESSPWLPNYSLKIGVSLPGQSNSFGKLIFRVPDAQSQGSGAQGGNVEIEIKTDIDSKNELTADGAFWRTDLAQTEAKQNSKGKSFIDGSLQLTISSDKFDGTGSLLLSFSNRETGEPFYLWQLTERNKKVVLSYTVSGLRIPLTRVLPAVADRFWEEQYLPRESTTLDSKGVGFQTEMPIVIPLDVGGRKGSNQPNYLLVVNESIGPLQSLRTDLEIERYDRSDELDNAQETFIVLQREPQIVAAVTAKLFTGKGTDTANTIIARKTVLSDQPGAWEFLIDRSVDSSFLLTLPAQGLGEELLISNDYNLNDHGDNPSNRIFDSRFTAPTQLRLEPSVLERRYVPALWNLPRLWGRPGDVAPGIPIKQAIFELLYGLEGNLELDGLRLAELASKLGQVPPPASSALPWEGASDEQKQKRAEFWNAYRELYLAWIRRIAVIEPWKDSADASLKISKGLSYRARVGLPKDEKAKVPRGAQLAWPDIPDTEATDEEKALHNSKEGLKGGFHIGVPSYPIYKELMRDWHQSSSAEVSGLAFSSLGGYGKQTARFSKDKSVIQSDTRAGRTNFYAFERIGRIGCLFNKAKYVVLCEREVGPSDQFADQQAGTEGRVLLRKVAEFIEILEPMRKFPDFEGVSVQSADQVRASYFPGTIIPVQASWGRNVYNKDKTTIIGWEIPIWQVGADPEIYQRPQVQLGIATDGSTNASLDFKNCLHPERIYFYTSINPNDGSDTNQWYPVEGPDFTDLPFPKPVSTQAPYRSKDQLDSPLEAPVGVPPGFERFTFELEDTGVRSTLAGAYYPNSNMTGSLRTVSMMRSREGGLKPKIKQRNKESSISLPKALKEFLTGELQDCATLGNSLKEYWETYIINWYNRLGSIADENLLSIRELLGDPAIEPWLARQIASLVELVLARLDSAKRLIEAEILASKAAIARRLSDEDRELKKIEKMAADILYASVGRLDALRTDLHRWIDRVIDQGVLTIQTIERSFIAGSNSIETKATEIVSLAEKIIEQLDDPNLSSIRIPTISFINGKLNITEEMFAPKIAKDIDRFFGQIRAIANGDEFSMLRDKVRAISASSKDAIKYLESKRGELHSNLRKRTFDEDKSHFYNFKETEGKNPLKKLLEQLWGAYDPVTAWKTFNTPFINDFLKSASRHVSELVEDGSKVIERLNGDFEGYLLHSLGTVEGELGAYLKSAIDSDIARHINEIAGKGIELVRQVEGVGSLLVGAKQEASKVLSNFRTVWDEVAAPGLSFNRESLARIVQFNPENIEERLAITPCIAKVREIGDQLEGMGLRLPAFGISDQLLTACESYFSDVEDAFKLESFDFSAILSDIGGIKLDKLFPDFKMPDWAHDKVKITHGFDRTKLNAWVNAESDIKLETEQKMFDFEGVRIDLIEGRFLAVARIETDGAGERKTARGEITGSLRASLQGQEVILFRDVRINFDDGKPDVKIDPSKIEMPGLLKQLSDISSNLEEYLTLEDTPGFSISSMMQDLQGLRVPVGVKAKLNLGPFDFGAGTSSVSGMFVGGLLQLEALTIEQNKPKLDFALTLGFNLGTDKQPFNIAIFLLGGGGVFDIFVKYKPQTNYILCTMKLKIQASACFNVSWGPFKGNIQGAYQLDAMIERGEGANENIPITCTMRNFGTVDVGGLASIYIEQAFGVTYQKDKESKGTELRAFGRLEATIRVSKFFKPKFGYNVSQKLATISSRKLKTGEWETRAKKFLAHF